MARFPSAIKHPIVLILFSILLCQFFITTSISKGSVQSRRTSRRNFQSTPHLRTGISILPLSASAVADESIVPPPTSEGQRSAQRSSVSSAVSIVYVTTLKPIAMIDSAHADWNTFAWVAQRRALLSWLRPASCTAPAPSLVVMGSGEGIASLLYNLSSSLGGLYHGCSRGGSGAVAAPLCVYTYHRTPAASTSTPSGRAEESAIDRAGRRGPFTVRLGTPKCSLHRSAGIPAADSSISVSSMPVLHHIVPEDRQAHGNTPTALLGDLVAVAELVAPAAVYALVNGDIVTATLPSPVITFLSSLHRREACGSDTGRSEADSSLSTFRRFMSSQSHIGSRVFPRPMKPLLVPHVASCLWFLVGARRPTAPGSALLSRFNRINSIQVNSLNYFNNSPSVPIGWSPVGRTDAIDFFVWPAGYWQEVMSSADPEYMKRYSALRSSKTPTSLQVGSSYGVDNVDQYAEITEIVPLLPNFHLGRPAFDNWMLHKAVVSGAAVFDLTGAIPLLHPTHSYVHIPASSPKTSWWETSERKENYALGESFGGWQFGKLECAAYEFSGPSCTDNWKDNRPPVQCVLLRRSRSPCRVLQTQPQN